MRKFLILLLLTLKVASQEIEEIHPFYLENISAFKAFYENSEELNPEKLSNLFNEVYSLPKLNSVNSKFYKENNNSIFEIYDEKKIQLKVFFKNDIKNCNIYLFSNGKVKHEIPYLNGKANGIYKVFLSNGSLLFETEYNNGKRNGVRKFYTLSENRIIEGNFIDGQITGKIKVSEPENNRYMLYPNNLENGIIEYYDANSRLYCEVPFINKSIVHGQVVYYYNLTKKKRLVENHINGELDGKTIYFDNNENLKHTLIFKKGKPIGEHKTFYFNGNIYEEGLYDEHGIKTGIWKKYNETGNLTNEIQYIDGKLNGTEKVYIDNFLVCLREYKDGKEDGIWKSWNLVTKKLEYEKLSKNGITLNSSFYFKNGKISRKFEFNSKNQIIKAEYYNKQGELFYQEKYNTKKNSEGVHKTYMYDRNEDYFLYSEEEYNKDEFKIREKIFLPNDEYVETEYNLNGHSIKTIYKDKKISKEYYLYKTKKVSLEEFNQHKE